jgi:hypothetical protein
MEVTSLSEPKPHPPVNVPAFAPPVDGTGWIKYHAVPSLATAHGRVVPARVDPMAVIVPKMFVASTVYPVTPTFVRVTVLEELMLQAAVPKVPMRKLSRGCGAPSLNLVGSSVVSDLATKDSTVRIVSLMRSAEFPVRRKRPSMISTTGG